MEAEANAPAKAAAPPVPEVTPGARISAAVLYGMTSLLIVAMNKEVLTSYAFPSSNVLAMGQFVFTLVAMLPLHLFGLLKLEPLSGRVVSLAGPLSILFLVDVLCSLAATQRLSLPMFTVLRRFAIPMTMLLEKAWGQATPPRLVQFSVWMMVVGALVAAYDDLGYDFLGYVLVLIGDAMTALHGCLIKFTLSDKSKLDKVNLMFYNALFSSLLMTPLLLNSGDELTKTYQFSHWGNSVFLVALFCAVSLGLALQYTIALCTEVNSALTTGVVGCFKNVVTAYMGMIIGGDYLYSPLNFAGVTIGVIFSVVYSFATFRNFLQPSKPDAALTPVLKTYLK